MWKEVPYSTIKTFWQACQEKIWYTFSSFIVEVMEVISGHFCGHSQVKWPPIDLKVHGRLLESWLFFWYVTWHKLIEVIWIYDHSEVNLPPIRLNQSLVNFSFYMWPDMFFKVTGGNIPRIEVKTSIFFCIFKKYSQNFN